LFASALNIADRTVLELSQGRYAGISAVSDITVPVWYDQVSSPTIANETSIVSALGTDGGSGYPTGWTWTAGGSTPTVSGGYQVISIPALNNATTALKYGSLATTPCSPGDIITATITLSRPDNSGIQGNVTATFYCNSYTSVGSQISVASVAIAAGNDQTYSLTLQPAATSAFYQIWIYIQGSATNTATTIKAKSLTVTRTTQLNALYGTNALGALSPTVLPRIVTAAAVNTVGALSRPSMLWPSATNTYTYTTYNSFATQQAICPVQYQTGTQTTWATSSVGVFSLVSGNLVGLGAALTTTSVWYASNTFSTGIINNAAAGSLNGATALPLPLSVISAAAGTQQSASTFGVGNDRNLSNRGWQGYIPGMFVYTTTLSAADTTAMERDIGAYYGITVA